MQPQHNEQLLTSSSWAVRTESWILFFEVTVSDNETGLVLCSLSLLYFPSNQTAPHVSSTGLQTTLSLNKLSLQ